MDHYSLIEYKHPIATDYYYDVEHTYNSYCPRVFTHTHNYFEFYVYISGKIQFLIDDCIYNVKKGDVIIVPPYHTHNLIPVNKNEPYERMYLNATETCLASFQFNQHSLMKPLLEVSRIGKFCYSIHDPHDFETILQSIDYMKENKGKCFYGKEMIDRSCILRIVSIVNKYVMEETDAFKMPETDTLLSKIIAYINKHYTKKLSIDALCRKFLTNRQTLTKLFKESTSLTLHHYTTLLRISYAKQLIAQGNKPSKIYSLCGFDDYSTFYRAFKKWEKLTPKEFETITLAQTTDPVPTIKNNRMDASDRFHPDDPTSKVAGNDCLLEENTPITPLVKECFYINSYIKKHADQLINENHFVSELLRNDSTSGHSDTHEYVVPGYIPVVGLDGKATDEPMVAGRKSIYTYPIYVPKQNSYRLTLVGSAKQSSGVRVKIQNHVIDDLVWNASSDAVSTKKAYYLMQGSSTLSVEVESSHIELTDLYVDLASVPSKCPVEIVTSTDAEGTKASNVYDGVAETVWRPAFEDANPWIEFRFPRTFYFDHFSVTGMTSNVKGYEIQVGSDQEQWLRVFHGKEIESGKEIYIQGTQSIKGKRFRIRFTKLIGSLEISEMKLSPYINWAREDARTAVRLTKESDRDSRTIINGDRIHPGWIAIGGQAVTLTFDQPHTIDAVTVVGIQESVQEGKEGVIPDPNMTSRYVQRQYTIYYLNQSKRWIRSVSYVTMPDNPKTELLRKVINKFVLEKPVRTTAIRVEIGTSYWIRVMELETVESFEMHCPTEDFT